jgi:hypothetical protein
MKDKKFNSTPFALALGITWGLSNLILGWAGMMGWGNRLVDSLGSFYVGYTPSFFGAIVGGIWGFVDGFIFGFIFCWLYNNVCCKWCK